MLKTVLYDTHVKQGARMVEFAGYLLPLLYRSILEEHVWTRRRAGLFDVSHLGRIELTGRGAALLLDRLTTRRISALNAGKTLYGLMCNETGGVLDDVMVSRLRDDAFYLVVNAANRGKILDHIERHRPGGVEVRDVTDDTIMLSIQGPATADLARRFLPTQIAELPYRHVLEDELYGVHFIAFRGGYTGENGFEAVFDAKIGAEVWREFSMLVVDGEKPIRPAGLGARDTLRLEAALPLYGHELSEEIDPISAGLACAVDFHHDFIGRPALETIARQGPERIQVALRLSDRRAARHGHPITRGGQTVGQVTSGAFCPTVNASIAMGYVEAAHAGLGTRVEIDTGRAHRAGEVVALPFYRRK